MTFPNPFRYVDSLRAAINVSVDIRDHRKPNPADLRQLGIDDALRNNPYFKG